MDTRDLQTKLLTLRSNKTFELFVVFVIIFSALVVGTKTYELPTWSPGLIHILDIGITLIFLFEISIRFMAEERKRDFFKSGWNLFDTSIVIISLIPIQDSEMALLGRLVRIFRVLRMVSVIPELRMLLNSLLKAMPQPGYVVLLTLFRIMTFEDWTDVMYETMAVYPFSWISYISFIFLSAFAFLNMVIGIVVGTMDLEQKRMAQEHSTEPSMSDLQCEIGELKQMVARLA
jgi:voltage-gated sodium channel